jgi:hypothetical protein
VLQKYTAAGVSRAWKSNPMFNGSCMIFSHDNFYSEWSRWRNYSEFSEFEDRCTYKIFRESWLH